MPTSEQSAELEALGTAIDRLKLFLFRRTRAEFVSAFKSGALKRSDVEGWPAEKYAKTTEKVQGTKLMALTDHKPRAATGCDNPRTVSVRHFTNRAADIKCEMKAAL
jgi:hypothetical protein